eukprot:GILK01009207.1.p1 GENE.GILK01009207.1~~GILK01009207.1.p1  ORF type:complete len:177 (+),score=0.28 GILK01009207.1:48-578(+)
MGGRDLSMYYRISGLFYLVYCIVSLVMYKQYSGVQSQCEGDTPTILLMLGLVYLFQSAATLIVSYTLHYFSDLPIDKFANLNACQNMMGILCKVLPYLTRLLHYVVLVGLIALLVITYALGICDTGAYAIVMCGLWLGVYIFGSLFRNCITHDPWFYQPSDPDLHPCFRFFKLVGP